MASTVQYASLTRLGHLACLSQDMSRVPPFSELKTPAFQEIASAATTEIGTGLTN